MIFLYLFIVLVLLLIIITYSFLFNNNKKNNKKNNNNEKFTTITKKGINRQLYLNPPKNANKYGIIDNVATFKCENDNCIIEDFDNPTPPSLENDIINNDINRLVIEINNLVNRLDNLTIYINSNIVGYEENYKTFKTELNKSITNKKDTIDTLVNTLGFNIVDSNSKPTPTPTSTSTPTPTSTSTPTPTSTSTPTITPTITPTPTSTRESFGNINDKLRNSKKQIDIKFLQNMKGNFILTSP